MSEVEVSYGKAFYPTVEALDAEVAASFADGDIDTALSRVQAFVQAVILDRRSFAKVFAEPGLDAWCQRIGARIVEQLPIGEGVQEVERADCVILATELYRTGGHSAVIEDLVRTNRFGPNIVVILTDVSQSADPSIITERFGSTVTGEVAPAGNLADKLRWTVARLYALRPHRLILFNHHHDAVAIAAAQSTLADETVFYHHADHQLCLGVTLEHTLHVDPHTMGFHNCREILGVRQNVFWPLVVEDLGVQKLAAEQRAPLRTCSSGSAIKFELDYKYQYVDLIPQLLARTGGTHCHIGPLSEGALHKLHVGLAKLSVPRDRFVHIPWVSSVWRALQVQQIDLYLASFPLGGGRVALEVMGAGVPIVGHDCYVSPFFGGTGMFYPEAFTWEIPKQLLDYLGSVERHQLELESRTARAHYEAHYTFAALTQAIDAGVAALPPPSLRKHLGDAMQTFLDEVHYALRDHLTAQEIAPVIERLKHELLVRPVEIDALQRGFGHQVRALIDAYGIELAYLIVHSESANVRQAAIERSLMEATGDLAQTRVQLAQAARHHEQTTSRLEQTTRRLAQIEASRSWRLARMMQRVAAVLRG